MREVRKVDFRLQGGENSGLRLIFDFPSVIYFAKNC